jgi:hypothetical protein
MTTLERVTVTLPSNVVASIDSFESNRSRFISDAVRRELARRRKAMLLESVRNPHPESSKVGSLTARDWGGSDDDASLVDITKGTPLRWSAKTGWKP